MAKLEMPDLAFKKGKEIKTPWMTVKENIISFADHFIQISNISQATAMQVKDQSYLPGILFLISGFAMFVGGLSEESFLIGVGLVIMGIGIGLLIHVSRANKTKGGYLILQMNSGASFSFHSQNYEFIKKVLETLKDCANNGSANLSFDFSQSTINGSNVFSQNANVG